ncbi:MAG: glycerophosphodiester phosphodiesterase [Dehalococcoidia bacterium]
MKPFVIGHATAGGEAPENTLAGVRAALDAGAEAMEIDVQISADGVPVLIHDATVDRTTNLKGNVRDLPLVALQAADAGGGEPIPTLDQVLDLVDGRLTVMCELKVDFADPAVDSALVDAVLATVRRHGAETWNAMHSFHPETVRYARSQAPEISAAIISVSVDDAGLDRLIAAALKRNAQAISLQYSCITPAFVRRAKQRQLSVWTWTPDTEQHWDLMITAGVDGIITNFPHQLRKWLESR